MGLQEILDSDLNNTFYADFGVACVYTPQGASALPDFPLILGEEMHQSFHDGNHTVEYVKRSARLRVSDVATIKILGKDGAGDSLTIGSKTWYVNDWLVNGNDSGTREHEIEITDKKIGGTRGR